MVRSSFLAVHGWHPSLYVIDRNETLKAESRAPDAEYIREWVKAYAETKPEGFLPNPYKYGVANTVWPDWTGLNNFWGLTAEGLWIDQAKTKDESLKEFREANEQSPGGV